MIGRRSGNRRWAGGRLGGRGAAGVGGGRPLVDDQSCKNVFVAFQAVVKAVTTINAYDVTRGAHRWRTQEWVRADDAVGTAVSRGGLRAVSTRHTLVVLETYTYLKDPDGYDPLGMDDPLNVDYPQAHKLATTYPCFAPDK